MKVIRYIIVIVGLLLLQNVSAQTVYTTKTGEKYHISNCRYLKYSKYSITIQKAKQLGYVACKVCKPTAENTKSNTQLKAKSLTTTPKSSSSSKKAEATRCTGKTKSGTRCKRKTKNANSRCYQH